ncbi:hypothetical protein CIPAW_11G094500 [Carya illinoinensis]|uniref:Secreted protein n=1 Tax=Carya illinoinensis TaxID=32201 RepID=A0A8T1P1S9_CARIL|nr:hypothetical protein CIPAW_11G094500 [Carya illinoinensis]
MLLVLLLVLSYPAQRRPKRFLMTRQTHCDCWSPRPLRVICHAVGRTSRLLNIMCMIWPLLVIRFRV